MGDFFFLMSATFHNVSLDLYKLFIRIKNWFTLHVVLTDIKIKRIGIGKGRAKRINVENKTLLSLWK